MKQINRNACSPVEIWGLHAFFAYCFLANLIIQFIIGYILFFVVDIYGLIPITLTSVTVSIYILFRAQKKYQMNGISHRIAKARMPEGVSMKRVKSIL